MTSSVQFPAMRRQVLFALAALADVAYQHAVWIERRYPTTGYFDDLSLNVHTMYDDCAVLPDPDSTLGTVLLPGDELARLRDLGRPLGDLIDRLGNAPDATYVSDEAWPEVSRLAGLALCAMVRAGGYAGDEPQ